VDNQNNPHAKSKALNPTSAFRRIVNAFQQWVELVDYSPFDYSIDRIAKLEAQVLEIERARNATVGNPPGTTRA